MFQLASGELETASSAELREELEKKAVAIDQLQQDLQMVELLYFLLHKMYSYFLLFYKKW